MMDKVQKPSDSRKLLRKIFISAIMNSAYRQNSTEIYIKYIDLVLKIVDVAKNQSAIKHPRSLFCANPQVPMKITKIYSKLTFIKLPRKL
jgi:hypothetical protein